MEVQTVLSKPSWKKCKAFKGNGWPAKKFENFLSPILFNEQLEAWT